MGEPKGGRLRASGETTSLGFHTQPYFNQVPASFACWTLSSLRQILSRSWKTILETEKNTKNGGKSQVTQQPREGDAVKGGNVSVFPVLALCLFIYCLFHSLIYSCPSQSYFPAQTHRLPLLALPGNRTYNHMLSVWVQHSGWKKKEL